MLVGRAKSKPSITTPVRPVIAFMEKGVMSGSFDVSLARQLPIRTELTRV
jgi:hypothetical protein